MMILKKCLFSILLSIVLFNSISGQSLDGIVEHSGKRGLGWASIVASDIGLFNWSTLISWEYNWSPNKINPMNGSGLDFLPMIWNGVDIDKFPGKVYEEQAKIILAFNEPDLSSQANMDPTTAAKLWIQYLEPMKRNGIKLGSPAVTQNGAWWLKEFFQACNGSCNVDFICAHWYGEGIGNFYDWLWSFYYQFKIPLWITEFGCTSSTPADIITFLNATTTYLDSLAWVEKYAWFGAFRDSQGATGMVNSTSGQLNQLGRIYTGLSYNQSFLSK